ncbi:DNA repair protein RecN [Fulvivirga sp. M361]|uniref:DNA repair protein RecN n=1 Tax=Fulvivirga sp. M361 TaxID=2594266 RepID=UPI00117BB3B9|nr:DNA repair protein RecN [Fulvivirga sp. M361]TRX52021.1 DNA repair protein RecN [Fulvivirga sp. M361]
MLIHLVIKNYALIEQLELSPANGLNMITGETGAGKSIMLGAIGLLLGNRADTKALFNKEEKCIVEGHFELAEYELKPVFDQEDLDYESLSIIRREITISGKSRAFINDTPVTLDILKKIGLRLMDVHSQHETLHLGKNTFQLSFVDAYAGTIGLRKAYESSYKAYRIAEKKFEKLQGELQEIKKEADYDTFLLDELVNANLEAYEQEDLENRVALMENAEEIKTKLNGAIDSLSLNEFSSLSSLQEANGLLKQLSGFSKSYEDLHERLDSTLIEIRDIINELEKEEDKVEFDPEQTQLAQERLGLIYQLQQKHSVLDIKALIEIRDELQQKTDRFSTIDTELQEALESMKKCDLELREKGKKLSKQRTSCFKALATELTGLLIKVGIPEASMNIKTQKTEPGPHGIDRISILFSANKGVHPQELARVASGGEFSRLMFCVKYILADKVSLPTIIFDEIDTGISGEIALKLGDMMKAMSKKHQLITISHLPQVAAKGDRHYFVFKDNSNTRSITKVRELSPDERVTEIAKMIGGDAPSSIAYDNARELIGT